MPSAAYRARTPPVPVASSSGWACTAMSVKGRSVMKTVLLQKYVLVRVRVAGVPRSWGPDPGGADDLVVSVFPARAAPVPRSMQPCRPDRLFPARPAWPSRRRRFNANEVRARPARLSATGSDHPASAVRVAPARVRGTGCDVSPTCRVGRARGPWATSGTDGDEGEAESLELRVPRTGQQRSVGTPRSVYRVAQAPRFSAGSAERVRPAPRGGGPRVVRSCGSLVDTGTTARRS